jgi:hypothetical protein
MRRPEAENSLTGESHAEEVVQSSHFPILRGVCFNRRNPAGSSAGAIGAVSGRGSSQSVLHPGEGSEIELARSAAPASISDGAEVLVLARRIHDRSEGRKWLCLSGGAVVGQDHGDSEFWNPKVRAPLCLNAPAARTYLPIVLMKTKLVLAGKSKTEIAQALKSAMDTKELPPLEPNAMCYMMSKQQYLSDDDMHWHPHMMWYVPGDSAQELGSQPSGRPGHCSECPRRPDDRLYVSG